MANMLDTFTAANGTLLTAHTSDSGHGWTVPSGGTAWTINSGEAYAGVSFTTRCFPTAVPASADYTVAADFKRLTDVTGINGGIMARAENATSITGYLLRYVRSSNLWRVDRIVAGTTSVLGSTSAASIVNGQTYRLELTVDGSTITGKVDGVTVWTGTDTQIAGPGLAGITSGGGTSSATTGIHLDNFATTDKAEPVNPAVHYSPDGATLTPAAFGVSPDGSSVVML